MRPKAFLLNLQDPERSLDDPGLRALVAEGWTCAGSWPVVRNDSAGGAEQVQLMLLLWPPVRRPAEVYPTASGTGMAAALAYAVPASTLFLLVIYLWWAAR